MCMHATHKPAMVQMMDRRSAIETMLSAHYGKAVRVTGIERQPFAYQTSAAIESFQVELSDGTKLRLLLKDLSRAGLQPAARLTKPLFLHNPRREIAVYHHILSERQQGTATCYGSVADDTLDRFWLLLELVHGQGLYQIGKPTSWQAAARWLARLHCHWAGRAEEVRRRAPVLNYDAEFYRVWLERAVQFQHQKGRSDSLSWRRLVDGYGRVIERLVALPTTLIHGEFYASNVLIDHACYPVRLCPVDWEMAAIGPGLMDLAALTAGRWSDEERGALLEAYRVGLEEHSGQSHSLVNLHCDLEICRLHVAMQWLGWSANWAPPAEHAHDWLGDAIALAEKIGL